MPLDPASMVILAAITYLFMYAAWWEALIASLCGLVAISTFLYLVSADFRKQTQETWSAAGVHSVSPVVSIVLISVDFTIGGWLYLRELFFPHKRKDLE